MYEGGSAVRRRKFGDVSIQIASGHPGLAVAVKHGRAGLRISADGSVKITGWRVGKRWYWFTPIVK
jgi:hypothetical protein